MKYLLLLCLAACEAPLQPLCTTKRGLELMGGVTAAGTKPAALADSWTCDAFEQAEERAWQLFGSVADDRFRDEKRLKGWRVFVQNSLTWYNDANQSRVAGITYCEASSLLTGNAPPGESSLMHEMAHGIQRCCSQDRCSIIPYSIDPGEDEQHANWTHIGLRRQLDIW